MPNTTKIVCRNVLEGSWSNSVDSVQTAPQEQSDLDTVFASMLTIVNNVSKYMLQRTKADIIVKCIHFVRGSKVKVGALFDLIDAHAPVNSISLLFLFPVFVTFFVCAFLLMYFSGIFITNNMDPDKSVPLGAV